MTRLFLVFILYALDLFSLPIFSIYLLWHINNLGKNKYMYICTFVLLCGLCYIEGEYVTVIYVYTAVRM